MRAMKAAMRTTDRTSKRGVDTPVTVAWGPILRYPHPRGPRGSVRAAIGLFAEPDSLEFALSERHHPLASPRPAASTLPKSAGCSCFIEHDRPRCSSAAFYFPKSSRPCRGGIGIRTSGSAGGKRLGPGDDGSPPPAKSDDLLAAALTPSSTFRAVSGSVITEIMCLRPRQRGRLRTSSENTRFRRSAQRMYLWSFDGSPALFAASSSATSTSFGSFRTTGRGTTRSRNDEAGASTP